MILGIGVAVLVVVFLVYFLITRGNRPKDALFFGIGHRRAHFPTHKAKYFQQKVELYVIPPDLSKSCLD